MSPELPIAFPSEVDRVERQVAIERGWTPTERIAAVAESLKVVKELAAAGGRSAEQLANHERSEKEWRRIMKEFIAKHAPPTDR